MKPQLMKCNLAWINSVDYWETLLIMIKKSCGQFQRHYLEANTCKIAGSAHESRTITI